MASAPPAAAPLALPPAACASPARLQLQRPFTASGARATRLLLVQVHWGEHLDELTQDNTAADEGGGAGEDASDTDVKPSTYVALSTTQRRPVQHSGAGHAPSETHSRQDEDAAHCYELRSSPFATTRVVERTAHPKWNELLLVAMPIEWRQQADAAKWVLRVDVVRRDPSQQEDSCLACVELPLLSLETHRRPQHLAIELCNTSSSPTPTSPPKAAATPTPTPCVFLSLAETNGADAAEEVVEVLIQGIGDCDNLLPSTTPYSPREACIALAVSPLPAEIKSLRDLFTVFRLHPTPDTPSRPSCCVWISPLARAKPGDGGKQRLQWQFPVVFSGSSMHRGGPTEAQSGSAFGDMTAYAFTAAPNSGSGELPQLKRVADAIVRIRAVPLDGSVTTVECPLVVDGSTSADASAVQLIIAVRRWDATSWLHFQSSSVTRRVITTNRRHRRRVELQALEWTGALCRGLNRYPVSSFCDEGGLSSLLASYLAASASGGTGGGDSTHGCHPIGDPAGIGVYAPEQLLNQHVRLLQQEVMAKQATIHKLQQDVDARTAALQKCGLELMTAMKEVRARDELVAQVQSRLHAMEQRDADQTRELLETTGGLSGLRLDNQGTQRMNKLIFKYKEMEQKHQATLVELEDARRAARAFEHLERKYAELEQAHVVQAALVQRLQKEKAQINELQRTVRMQEKVIRKLETAVTLQQRSHEPPPRVDASEGTLPSADDDSPLLAVRVQVLEQQLTSNAKTAASEIGRLKMRIMELETQLSFGDANPQQYSGPRR